MFVSKVVLALVSKFSPSYVWPNPVHASAQCEKKKIQWIFQRWISWFPQRWRTPRNAIRNANCRIKWVIKSLNANCCSDRFSWSIPGSDSVNHHNQLHVGRMGRVIFMRLEKNKKNRSFVCTDSKPIKVLFCDLCLWVCAPMGQQKPNSLELSSGKKTRRI